MSFTWVPFYREVAERVLEYEDRQDELLALLREMEAEGLPTMFLDESQAEGPNTPLEEIDPFTFLANFSRTADPKARQLCERLREKWDLKVPTPTDFDGRANVVPLNPWFFSSNRYGREETAVPNLWRLARQALGASLEDIEPGLFDKCMAIHNVGIKKLTAGLFWLSPQEFLPLSGPVVPYLKEKGVTFNKSKLQKGDLDEYRQFMQSARAVNPDFVAISHDSWIDALEAKRKSKSDTLEATEEGFTWVPFYREVAARVLEYEGKPAELLEVLREMKAAGLPTIPLEHDQPTLTPLTTIDPLTWMANFGRTLEPSSFKICEWIRDKWDIKAPTPTDFEGRHAVQSSYRGSWFFGSLAERVPNDTDDLWQLAKQAVSGDIDALDETLVARCLAWPNLRMKKLSMGLSWLNPEAFLPLPGWLLDYAESLGIPFRRSVLLAGDLDEYRAFLNAARQIEPSYPAFVKAAYQTQPAANVDENEEIEMPNFPLNQILYGPPGTGKTYSTIERAVEIIDGVKLPHDEAKLRFEELRQRGQIEFVTFHQSFSYEEFIEGLRPILDEDGDGQARYEIRDGVLKTLALRALGAALEQSRPERATFEQLWNLLLEKMQDEDWLLPGIGSSTYKLALTSAGNLTGDNIKGQAQQPYNAAREKVKRTWEALRDGPTATHNAIMDVLHVGTHTNLIGAVVEELKRIEKQSKTSVLSEPMVPQSPDSAQSFLDNSPDYRANFSTAPRYVLIVDEINRGNISKILGELITLLEEDKRIGAANELRVQLPVSGDHFALPPNLYLLGTMNTADKSLALLDIALRRRFDFIEMAPDSEKFPDFARDVLTQLNLRLEAAIDREHRIGHAYFIGRNSAQCNAVFRAKIIPLLQEYFYNDWEMLRAVLGESGDKDGAFIKKLVAPQGMKARTTWRWWFDVDGVQEFDYLAALRENYGAAPG